MKPGLTIQQINSIIMTSGVDVMLRVVEFLA